VNADTGHLKLFWGARYHARVVVIPLRSILILKTGKKKVPR
jgi:hypothetical protein